MSELRAMAHDAIARKIFPGATVYLSRAEKLFAHEAFGTTAYDSEYSWPVSCDTLYDLASLTKLFTVTAFIIAARETNVDASTFLHEFFPEFKTTEKRGISLRHLLQHNSGIEIAIQDLTDISPALWRERIAVAPLTSRPGARVFYSCTNYFLLARVIENLVEMPLDKFIEERILAPLEMHDTTFLPLQNTPLDLIAPTEIHNCAPCHGVVHDEAARTWQEYSGNASCGNAGLFGTAADVGIFCRSWCDEEFRATWQVEEKGIIFDSEIETAFSDSVPEGVLGTRRGWSFQIDAKFFMSEIAPPGSIGHAGFTGPTLWCNRRTRDVCVILNNRVYPTRNGPERFPVHRRIARWFINNQ